MDAAGDDTAAIQDDDGNDAASFTTGAGEVPAVTNGSAVPPTVPGQPKKPVATAQGPNLIVVRWEAPADRGGLEITGYIVEISTDNKASWAPPSGFDARASEDALVRTYEDRNSLEAGVTRHYRVKAINPVGIGPASDSDEVTTTATTPAQPEGLTATPGVPEPPDGTTLIELSWTAPKEPEETDIGDITGYLIEWSRDGTDSSWEILVEDTGDTDVTYSDTGLGSEETRHYRVP